MLCTEFGAVPVPLTLLHYLFMGKQKRVFGRLQQDEKHLRKGDSRYFYCRCALCAIVDLLPLDTTFFA